MILSAAAVQSQTVWLDTLDLSAMECGWGSAGRNKSVEEHPLTVAGQVYERGVGTHAVSTMLILTDGKGTTFHALVGVDDEATDKATVEFYVLGDRKILWQSGVMKKGMPAKPADVDIAGIQKLGLLVTDAGDGIDYDHADWCDAKIGFSSVPAPAALTLKHTTSAAILTPKPSDEPRINGARVVGVRPGHPFLYKIAATGKRPMKYEIQNCPPGLDLDPESGIITGTPEKRGAYAAIVGVTNAYGRSERPLRIEVGDQICLTPPMGWNSWNCWACAVDDGKVRASADAMVASGLSDHGWSYINIDDCWEIKPDAKDPILQGVPRNSEGLINTNSKFPDMKALADYIHSKGLKIGIYSGPGPKTCAGFTASYQFEKQDARRYAEWGIDYLKYDWCSYGSIAKDRSLPELKKPSLVMRKALDDVPRDIVYSLCQYGMGTVWEWGAEVGGNCWRTTGDIGDSWASMSEIGFGQAGHEKYAGPGHWNDPDMLVVGYVGWGPDLHPTGLTPDEQYTHITLWSLLAAPLLIGCDLTKLDDFTLNLLTNDEVIDVDQDPLGKAASRISNEGGRQVWVRPLEDGSFAAGLFYTGITPGDPAGYFQWEPAVPSKVRLNASDLRITGRFQVRDLWRQHDIGMFREYYETDVPYHGAVLVRITPEK